MRILLLVFVLLAMIGAAGAFSQSTFGQDSREKASQEAGAAGEEASSSGDMTSYVAWAIKSSGAIGGFILILSIYFVVTVVRLSKRLRADVAAPPEQLKQLELLLEEKDHRGLIAFARANNSFLCRVLTFGLLELPNGLPQAQETMERHGEMESVEMENGISMLAVLGTLGPMIGLIGTLKGMIGSFSVIAAAGAQLRTSEVAGGISEALLLTFEGVALSVPAIYFYAVFRNRVSSISVGTMLKADILLRQFSASVRAKSNPTSSAHSVAA